MVPDAGRRTGGEPGRPVPAEAARPGHLVDQDTGPLPGRHRHRRLTVVPLPPDGPAAAGLHGPWPSRPALARKGTGSVTRVHEETVVPHLERVELFGAAPREEYFEKVAEYARRGPEELDAFQVRHDSFFVDPGR